MTDSTNTQSATSKKPTHYAYNVQNVENEKSIWNCIGTVWPHKDGKGFNVHIPNGRIVLRVATEKSE